MKKEIKTNKVFHHIESSDKRFIVEQGGTRSGKTYNILLWVVSYCFANTNKTIAIVRKTYPALRTSVMRDFFEILENIGIYAEQYHNKAESSYYLNGNRVEFISVDSPQKIRGRKRDICFINEANEITSEDFFQLNVRTTERIIIDYNPSEEFWVFDEVIPREDCDYHITTYKDNKFLSPELVREIELLEQKDEYYWKVYGLGELAAIQGVVFTNWVQSTFNPDDYTFKGYGMDFGFTNDPTTLIEVREGEGELWVRELIFTTGLTNQDISAEMKLLDVKGDIVADSAEPKSIEELSRLGWNIRPAIKGTDSVRAGIDLLRQYKINVHSDSVNLVKEFKSYKHKQDKSGKYLNEPVDAFNHGIDALRYFVFTNNTSKGYGKYVFI